MDSQGVIVLSKHKGVMFIFVECDIITTEGFMKTISMLFSILIILSICTPFVASGLPSGTAKVVSAGLNNQASQAGNSALLGTTIQQKALESEISHPTPVSGSDSSNPSGQGQTGSGQGQMGSGQGQTGVAAWPPVKPYPGSYQTSGDINFWIDMPQGRMQYVVVPQYLHIALIASTPLGGQGVVYELYPNATGQGVYSTNVYNLNPGDNRLEFAADIVGRHILLFSINDQASNGVVVDVQGSINSSAQQNNGAILGQGVGV